MTAEKAKIAKKSPLSTLLIVLMTSALMIAIWGVARDRLVAIVQTALSTVCGRVGC
ncbi:MAG: hypothetical protein QOH48_273 [Actinomycetota bacterium]|jgi:hypothetical protein|nr:hypothetical protein [Actinomycetota bacterium]